MIEPPSQELIARLLDLKLCSASDVRRCRRLVKRLACDLPAFDSVWIDALLQARKLTPFQAKVLESSSPYRLRVGPCVLVDQLGHGLAANTFLARKRDGNERCVLKLIDRPPESKSLALKRLEELASRLKGFAHTAIAFPHSCLQTDGQLVTISRYVLGPQLGELLVRRGRFPAAMVLEIGRQLADGLADLEQSESVHGEIRLCNVRLTSAGVVVLVDAGIGPAVSPELTIHAALGPERYDAVAPELIGTGNHPSAVSDLYALGCLLWQLLAGRPPFPTGDPLAKLAAHQTREVDDIREWAPDTPDSLADTIRKCTAHDPTDRPKSFAELRQHWGRPRRCSRRTLWKFRARFNTTAPRIPIAAAAARSAGWPMMLMLLFLLSGVTLTLLDRGARSYILDVGAKTANWVRDQRPNHQQSTNAGANGVKNSRTSPQLQPIPGPDADGVVQLRSAGPYQAAEISAVGPLVIRGTTDRQTEIVVTDEPLKIWAEQLVLQNVHVRLGNRPHRYVAAGKPSALVLVEAQNLLIRNCSFQTDSSPQHIEVDAAESETSHQRVAVAWKLVDTKDHSGGRVAVRNSLFSGAGSALFFSSVPRNIQITNCLKLSGRAFLALNRAPQPGHEVRIELDRLTLRRAEALLSLRFDRDQTESGRIALFANDCVLKLAGRDAALFQLVSERHPAEGLSRLQMIGEGSLAEPELLVASWLNPAKEKATPLDPAAIALEGISAAGFEFVGPFSPDPADSVIKSFQAPRRSSDPPGIDAKSLAMPRLRTDNSAQKSTSKSAKLR